MELRIAGNREELSHEAAVWITDHIKQVLKEKDRYTLVLCGGSTPKKLYKVLASDAFKDKIDWGRLHFFWGDERFVPFSDERNNAKMAFDNLLGHVPVQADNVHVMRTDIDPEAAAREYEDLLHAYFPGEGPTFDLVLMGMGDNAHTLSLFPGYDVVHEKKKWVTSFYLEEQKMYRITLTAPVVNRAGRVAFLVSGKDKAAAIAHVLNGEYEPDRYPAQVIQPVNDQLYWWLDEEAAGDIG